MLNLHKEGSEGENIICDNGLIQYIDKAKLFDPVLTRGASERLTNYYCEFRNLARDTKNNLLPVTPRLLFSLLNSARSMAKLRHSNFITVDDIDESARLIDKSHQNFSSIFKQDLFSKFWDILMELNSGGEVEYLLVNDFMKQCKLLFNTTSSQIWNFLELYENLDIFRIDQQKFIRFNV